MRKLLLTFLTLWCAIGAFCQEESNDIKTMVVKTTDGKISKFNIENISEITFDSAPAGELSTITRLLNLTPEFISVSGLEENQTLMGGEQAVLTLTAGPILSSGFQSYHFEHLHIQVNDQIIIPEVPEGYVPSAELKVAFAVPEGNCDIVVCYSGQQQMTPDGFTMTLENNPHVKLYGVSPSAHYKYFDAFLLADEAYVIKKVEFKMGDNPWEDVATTTGCSFTQDYNVPNLYQITIRPDYQNVTGDVTLRVSGEQHHRYNISWKNADNKYLDLERSILPTEAIDGETVTAELYVNNEYYLNGASANDNTPVETLYYAYVRFTMPDNDIEITLDILDKVPVEYKESAHVAEATIYDAPDMYYGVPTSIGIPGEKVYVIAAAENGFKPMKAVTEDGDSYTFTHYGNNLFLCGVEIPKDATSLKFTIECAEAWKVSSKQYVVFNGGQIYSQGETVSFAMEVPAGKKIESVTATTESGKVLDVTLDLPYASFVMPAEDVEVSVTYADLEGSDNVSVIAYFDEDQYSVRSSTNYDWDFAEGFEVEQGSTFYVSVYDDYGENFYVGVKIGETVTIYPAVEDEESGEYTFGKALVADGDVVIKVGPTENSVKF